MRLTRRDMVLGLAGLGLAGCGGAATSPVPTVARNEWRAVPNAGFDAWLDGFRGRAAAQGLDATTIQSSLRGAGYLPKVVERDRNQTEFSRSLEDYLAIAASDERVAMGRDKLRRQGATLAAIETRYGVEARVVTAVWGLESYYGTRMGDAPVISALATLAYDGRRGDFFEKQLVAALKIIQAGDIAPAAMTGSWAGAMGHTQFIPTSYLAYAVDFTGDGRRDIWSADPADALASTAAYLQRFGWRRGQPWGLEVALPAGFDAGLTGRSRRQNVGNWSALGVRPAAGGSLPDHGSAAVLAPAGVTGPAFLVFRNFDVILRYNNAESYGIGIGHLSDRISGGGPIRGRFPPDAYGLTIDERRQLQARLTAQGFDTGGTDGVIGPQTRAAIAAYQQSVGLPATGDPSQALLRRLG